MLKKIALIGATVASAFAMHTGEININDTDLELSAKIDIGQFNHNVEPNTTFLGARFLNVDKSNSSRKNLAIDPYYELNFLMQRELASTGLTLGMGAKLNHTKEYLTIPLGLELAYKIPVNTLIPLYLSGSLYYAPRVLSMQSAENFLEYRAGFEIEVIKNGRVIIGYRNLDTNYEVRDFNYNRSWYAGFKIAF